MRQKHRLGDILIERGLLTPDDLEKALSRQDTAGKRLGKVLIDMGIIDEEDMVNALSDQFGIKRVDIHSIGLSPDIASVIPKELMERHRVFPVTRSENTLEVAMMDPFDIQVIDDLKNSTGLDIVPVIATEGEMRQAFQRQQDLQDSANVVIAEYSDDDDESEQSDEMDEVAEVPTVKVVNLILYQAIQKDASDIHIQPGEKESVVRFRVDGSLNDVMQLPKRIHADVVSRLKVMADLDITRKRQPQDGRLRVTVNDKKTDMRMSTLPGINGEKVVLRVPDGEQLLTDLDKIGFYQSSLDSMKQMLLQPHGLILVTGPTGSGKTTTLYSFMRYLNDPRKNIVTVEDPVEYRVPGITQVQVHKQGGVAFADGLRAVVRQDPDIIMVGEIRDSETASIALRAALTGHLVLSTLHTNDAAGAIVRLLDLGVEPFMISATVIGVVAQRLVRYLCKECREPADDLTIAEQQFLGKQEATVYRGRACNACDDQGFKGRIPVEEVLVMTKEIRKKIQKNVDENEVRDYAVEHGMVTLKDNARKRVLEGDTTVSEAVRGVYTVDDILKSNIEFVEALN